MMGHYRSEMISDEQQDKEANEKYLRRQRLIKNIKQQIKERGIEELLADMIESDALLGIRNRLSH
jgi:hypothetical protein